MRASDCCMANDLLLHVLDIITLEHLVTTQCNEKKRPSARTLNVAKGDLPCVSQY